MTTNFAIQNFQLVYDFGVSLLQSINQSTPRSEGKYRQQEFYLQPGPASSNIVGDGPGGRKRFVLRGVFNYYRKNNKKII